MMEVHSAAGYTQQLAAYATGSWIVCVPEMHGIGSWSGSVLALKTSLHELLLGGGGGGGSSFLFFDAQPHHGQKCLVQL